MRRLVAVVVAIVAVVVTLVASGGGAPRAVVAPAEATAPPPSSGPPSSGGPSPSSSPPRTDATPARAAAGPKFAFYYGASASSDLRVVAFVGARAGSRTRNVFVYNRETNAVGTISAGLGGAIANGDSSSPVVSADGSRIAFVSDASNLVPGDDNRRADLFVRDLAAHKTVRLTAVDSPSSPSIAPPAISGDGRYVAIATDLPLVESDENGRLDAYRIDVATRKVVAVSVMPNGSIGEGSRSTSDSPVSISRDGSLVAFDSDAGDQVVGDTNGKSDVFVRDIAHGTTERVSVDRSGGQSMYDSYNATISGNGNVVAFTSCARLEDSGATSQGATCALYVRDVASHRTRAADPGCEARPTPECADEEQPRRCLLTADGTLAYANTDAGPDGETVLIDLQRGREIKGEFGNSADWISDDGRYLLFYEEPANSRHPNTELVLDRTTNEVTELLRS